MYTSLGLEDNDERINPNGGAIAIGHPLGMTGARLLNTATIELHEKEKKICTCNHVYWRWSRICNNYRKKYNI